MADKAPVLILGGTREALDLAAALDGRFDVVTSLAGRTSTPTQPRGRLRVGGFGGASGMAEYLRAENIAVAIDATHPFAARISANAAAACAETGIPRLVLRRPEWQPETADHWIDVASPEEAASRLAALGNRVFLSVGRQDLGRFADCDGVWFLLRTIEPLGDDVPLGTYEAIVGRGPFSHDHELALLERHAIDLVISRNSGGAATRGKLSAARALGLPVVMIRRPPAPEGAVVDGIDEAVRWIQGAL
jgi:precorrin-6A/cobalt-precorrin-6A reductase